VSPLHKRRLTIAIFILFGFGLTIGLVSYALKENINLYYTPSQLQQVVLLPTASLRVGGMVQKGSIHHAVQGLAVNFVITDFHTSIPVHYQGVLPGLFRDEQGVVVRGQWRNQILYASEVLAKHDERYMPVEAKDALAKAQGAMHARD
jgi:cytochrome c-type biogenesis protein CcmE